MMLRRPDFSPSFAINSVDLWEGPVNFLDVNFPITLNQLLVKPGCTPEYLQLFKRKSLSFWYHPRSVGEEQGANP